MPPLPNCSENARTHPFCYGSAARMRFFLPAKRLKSRNYRQPLQNPSENTTFDCQENPGEPKGAQESPGEPRGAQGSPGEKQNTLCQCRKNANFECHHCKTAARIQKPICFTMDPQRECFFLLAKRLKHKTNASETLEKQKL